MEVNYTSLTGEELRNLLAGKQAGYEITNCEVDKVEDMFSSVGCLSMKLYVVNKYRDRFNINIKHYVNNGTTFVKDTGEDKWVNLKDCRFIRFYLRDII